MAQPGIIAPPSPMPAGLATAIKAALVAAGFAPLVEFAPDGIHVSDVPTAQSAVDTYVGSASELAFSKAQKLSQLDPVYLGKFGAGFSYVGLDAVTRLFQIDPTSQFNIDVQANASLGAMLNGEAWDAASYFIAADNSHMPTPTAQDMRAFALAVRSYVSGLILRNRALKDAILAAADMATLAAIDVTSGWPVN